MAITAEQRAGLLAAKLNALCRRLEIGELTTSPFPSGAAAISGTRGVVLFEEPTDRSLGGAVLWASRKGCDELLVLVDGPIDLAAIAARQAGALNRPVSVFTVDGATPVLVDQPATWSVPPEPPAIPDEIADFVGSLGAKVVSEGDVVTVEFRGLECARWNAELGQFEVGVGRFDREITAMMAEGVPADERLRRAVDYVAQFRFPGAPMHPLATLASQRWLREVIIDAPERVGADTVRPVGVPIAMSSLRDTAPAGARCEDTKGTRLALCYTTVDPGILAIAADAVGRDSDTRVTLVRPRRMAHQAFDHAALWLRADVDHVEVELPGNEPGAKVNR